jgi:uncharacterized protein (TIGR03067 family)
MQRSGGGELFSRDHCQLPPPADPNRYAFTTKENTMRTTLATAVLVFVMALNVLMGAPGRAEEPKSSDNPYVGSWRMVAVIVDGKDTPTGSATINTVTENGWIVTVDGKLYSKGTSKRYPDNPNQTDVIYAEGVLAGTTLKQIAKIEGDVMIACAGETRPTEFKSKVASGHTLSVWIRVK